MLASAWAALLASTVFAGYAFGQNLISGGSASSTVTAPATGAGVDTCTGAGCAIGAAGMSIDAGVIVYGDLLFSNNSASIGPNTTSGNCLHWGGTGGATNTWWMCGIPNTSLLTGNNTATYQSFSLATGRAQFPNGIDGTALFSSNIASGSIAFQSLTGAKTCLGTSGITCLSSNGTTTTSDSPFSVTGALLASSIKSTSTYVWSTGTFALGASGKDLIFSTAPTVSSGFGTGASITANNGPSAFRIGVGTTSGTTGVIGLPTAGVGWNCFCSDITTNSTSVFLCKQTAGSTTSATIGNFSDVAVATAWTNNDVLVVSCFAY